MPNWPISALAPAAWASAASLSRKARVPERAMVPSASTRSWRLMPTPLSAKVSVLASGSTVMAIAKGPPLSISSGLAQRLVAQLFAGVGGVGDEFAHKDVAVRIDRVDHQVQQPRDIGFELLGLGVGVGGGFRLRFSVGRQVGLMDNRIGNCGLAPARHMRRDARVSSVESACLADKKRGGPAGRGPADPPAVVA